MMTLSTLFVAAAPADAFWIGSTWVPPAPCESWNAPGKRVNIAYARLASQPRDPSIFQKIKNDAAYVSEKIRQAGGKVVRWVCNSATPGDVWVGEGIISARTPDACREMYNKWGSNYADRINICVGSGGGGWAKSWHSGDDSPGPQNRYNTGPSWAWVGDNGGGTLLHEFLHTIGAVQLSAPHSSGFWHCYDGDDWMCYNDGGSHFLGLDRILGTVDDLTMWIRCGTIQVDCGRDDYFNPSPASGSYLATHWNTYNSMFLRRP